MHLTQQSAIQLSALVVNCVLQTFCALVRKNMTLHDFKELDQKNFLPGVEELQLMSTSVSRIGISWAFLALAPLYRLLKDNWGRSTVSVFFCYNFFWILASLNLLMAIKSLFFEELTVCSVRSSIIVSTFCIEFVSLKLAELIRGIRLLNLLRLTVEL
mgnify:CR=1 FL=1